MILPASITPRQRQTLLWTAVGLLCIALLVLLGPILSPFLAAAILAYALVPGVEALQRRKVPRLAAVLLMMVLFGLAMLSIVFIIVPIIQQEFTQLRLKLPGLIETITGQLLPWIEQHTGIKISLDPKSLREWFTKHLASGGDDLMASAFAYFRSGWGTVLSLIGFLVLVPVALFFFLLDWPQFMQRCKELLPPRWHAQVFDVLAEVDQMLGQYLRGQVKVMLVLALYYSLALLIAGFKLWLPVGVLTGLMVAIPYLGFAMGLSFALIDGMLQMGPLKGLILVALIYGIGQMLEGFFLTPRLVGEQIGLHPLVVIFSLLAFGSVFGFVGVLLALPLAAICAVAVKRIRRAYLQSEFYGSHD